MKNPTASRANAVSPRHTRFVAKVAVVVALATTGLLTWSELSGTNTGSITDIAGPGAPGTTGGPLLIKHGWDLPDVSFVAANATSMGRMPFDGVVMRMDGDLSAAVQRQDPVSFNTFKSALSPLEDTDLTSMRHNFLMVYSTPAGDIFDSWSTPISNYTNVARAAREAGFEGIFLDNEEYFGNALDHPDNCGGDKTASQCRTQAFHRGQQVMTAIRSGWPEARVLVAHGPYIGDAATAEYFTAHGMAFNDISWANELRGAFAVGMAAATVDHGAQFIDGGEVYSARTVQNFEDLRYWQTEGLADQGSLIKDDLRPHWPATTSAAFGVYDSSSASPSMDPQVWGSTLTNALRTTDCYVWAYTEKHDWWGTGQPDASVPDAWVSATRRAQEETLRQTLLEGPREGC